MSRLLIQQAMYQAAQLQVAGKVTEAERICRQILEMSPRHSPALHLLGVIAINTGRADEAITLIERAIALEPYEGYFHYNLGLAYIFSGQYDRAAAAFRQAIAQRPNMVEAHGNLAASLLALQKFDETIEACRQAIIMHADGAQVHNAMGVALRQTGKPDQAIASFERALAIQPDFFESLSNLAHVLRTLGRLKEAIAIYRKAAPLQPDHPELHFDLAETLDDDNQIDSAIEEFRRALSLKPDNARTEARLANTLHRAGRFDEAIETCRSAVAHAADPALPRFNLGLMLLLQGRFEEGWQLREARWDVKQFRAKPVDFGKPKWDGSDLNGQTILIYSELGFGDTIQFARYLRLVRERHGRIIFGCQPEMVRLMRGSSIAEQVLAESDSSLAFSVHFPLLSLPMLFNTTLETIPAAVPYLNADPTLAALWQKRMAGSGFKVGLSWAGRQMHQHNQAHSVPLSSLAALGTVQDVTFYSLQKNAPANEAPSSIPGFEVADFSADIDDFADTAAIIENVDLVISADTAVAHLAAAIGKPVWLMLPFVPDWRWMLGRNDSPWYPTMRLFRQTRHGDWNAVIQTVKAELKRMISGLAT